MLMSDRGLVLGLLEFYGIKGMCEMVYGEKCATVNVGVAEAVTIRRWMEYARDKGVRDLLVESDSQSVIYV